MRTLMTFWGYCNKDVTTGKPFVNLNLYMVSTDLFGDQFFFTRIKGYDRVNKRLCIFKEFNVKLPDMEIVKEYEEKSHIQKMALRKDLLKDVLKFEKLSSANREEVGDLNVLAKKVIDDPELRGVLFAGKGISTTFLRAAMEREGHNLKVSEAELLKRIILKLYNPSQFSDQ
jgi:hypothetical protein